MKYILLIALSLAGVLTYGQNKMPKELQPTYDTLVRFLWISDTTVKYTAAQYLTYDTLEKKYLFAAKVHDTLVASYPTMVWQVRGYEVIQKSLTVKASKYEKSRADMQGFFYVSDGSDNILWRPAQHITYLNENKKPFLPMYIIFDPLQFSNNYGNTKDNGF